MPSLPWLLCVGLSVPDVPVRELTRPSLLANGDKLDGTET